MRFYGVLLFLFSLAFNGLAQCVPVSNFRDVDKDICYKNFANVKNFGATPNFLKDSSPAFQAALDASDVIYIPAGVYYIAKPIDLPSSRNILIYGDGDSSVIKTSVTAINQINREVAIDNLVLKSFKIIGDYDVHPTQLRGANLIELVKGHSLQMIDLAVENSRFFGIHAANFERILASNVSVRNVARDAMNFSGSQNIKIFGGSIYRAGDDAIAAHFGRYKDERSPYERNILIDGVDISDTLGIKVLGARVLKIVNNSISWPKGYAIFVGWDWVSKEGYISQYDMIISGNTISNWIGLNVFGYPNMDNHAIVLGSYPGRNDNRSDLKLESERDAYVSPIARDCAKLSRRAMIYGNILRRDSLAKLSYKEASGDYAFVDQKYNNNPILPDGFGSDDGVAIDVGGCWLDLNIFDNIFEGAGTVLRGMPDSNFSLKRVRFERNSVVSSKMPVVELKAKGAIQGGVYFSRMNHFRYVNQNSTDDLDYGFVYSPSDYELISDGDIFDGCFGLSMPASGNVVLKNPTYIGKCRKRR